MSPQPTVPQDQQPGPEASRRIGNDQVPLLSFEPLGRGLFNTVTGCGCAFCVIGRPVSSTTRTIWETPLGAAPNNTPVYNEADRWVLSEPFSTTLAANTAISTRSSSSQAPSAAFSQQLQLLTNLQADFHKSGPSTEQWTAQCGLSCAPAAFPPPVQQSRFMVQDQHKSEDSQLLRLSGTEFAAMRSRAPFPLPFLEHIRYFPWSELYMGRPRLQRGRQWEWQ